MTQDEIMQKLSAPFHPSDVEWRVQREVNKGKAVMVLPYINNRAVQNRLDEVFGVFGWTNKFISGPTGGLICELGVRNPENGEWVVKQDGAENTQVEAIKGGLSSAMKRTAVQLGIGRYLYYLDFQYASLLPKGEHYHRCKSSNQAMYWNTPNLPDWAIPKGN